jgi:hypothetical protein
VEPPEGYRDCDEGGGRIKRGLQRTGGRFGTYLQRCRRCRAPTCARPFPPRSSLFSFRGHAGSAETTHAASPLPLLLLPPLPPSLVVVTMTVVVVVVPLLLLRELHPPRPRGMQVLVRLGRVQVRPPLVPSSLPPSLPPCQPDSGGSGGADRGRVVEPGAESGGIGVQKCKEDLHAGRKTRPWKGGRASE